MHHRVRLALTSAIAALLTLSSLSSLPALPRPASAHADGPTTAPFGFAGTPTTSPDGVAYTLYSGKAPSFDGLPLDADVTIPAHATYPLPLVVFFHGWSNSKTNYESTTITNTTTYVSHWNNVSFAARGYAVLNYTDRGFHQSCGPDERQGNPTAFATDCQGRGYWIHLADPRWEIHDAQYLIGTLADEGIIDPNRIGVTGMSYGGAHSWWLAELNDRTMNTDSSLSPWTSPLKGIPLHIAAAVPQWTYSDLWNALFPNGRALDTDAGVSTTLESNPVGIPIQSYQAGLYAVGAATGSYAAPGTDPTADLTTWNARVTRGNPFYDDPISDTVTYQALRQYRLRSPLYQQPDADVPIYQEQGLTDPLFPPVQAINMRNHVLQYDPAYPIKSYFGDIGHSNANNPADEWDYANAVGNDFVDYYLKGVGSKPTFDVTAQTTTCVAGQTRQTYSAPAWSALSDASITLSSTQAQTTSNTATNSEGPAVDPIVHAGCLPTTPAGGAGIAAWTFPVAAPYTLLGQPTLTVDVNTTGTDAELNARLWDVSPDGSTETLVGRAAYRYVGDASTVNTPQRITYQLSGNAWQFQAGHTLRLEVLGNDYPYLQQDNIPAVTTILAVNLNLPLRATGSPTATAQSGSATATPQSGSNTPSTTASATGTTAPTATSPTPPNTAIPTATGTAVPTAPSTAVPTASNTAVPTSPSTAVPTSPSTTVPTATGTASPTSPSKTVPAATGTATGTTIPAATNTTAPAATGTAVTMATGTAVPPTASVSTAQAASATIALLPAPTAAPALAAPTRTAVLFPPRKTPVPGHSAGRHTRPAVTCSVSYLFLHAPVARGRRPRPVAITEGVRAVHGAASAVVSRTALFFDDGRGATFSSRTSYLLPVCSAGRLELHGTVRAGSAGKGRGHGRLNLHGDAFVLTVRVERARAGHNGHGGRVTTYTWRMRIPSARYDRTFTRLPGVVRMAG